MLRRWTADHIHALWAFLLQDPQANVKQLSDLNATGLTYNPARLSLRSGEYFGWFDKGAACGAIAFTGDGACSVYAPEPGAWDQMAQLISARDISLMRGAPCEAIFAIHARLGRAPVYESRAHIYALPRPETDALPEDYELLRVDAENMQAIEQATRIYNIAQDENYSVARMRQIVREMRGGERLLLGLLHAKPSLTVQVNAEAARLWHLGAMSVLPEARGQGLACATGRYLAHQACAHGFTPLVVVGDGNAISLNVTSRLGGEQRGDYGFIWYK